MPRLSDIQEGTVIADTYRVTRMIAEGGMGSVWRAEHTRLPGKRVAIKVLLPQVAENAEALARFRREAEIASRIGHPNIVEVHDFNMLPDGSPYLVLEYLQGQPLSKVIEAGAMEYARVARLIRQIGSALRAAHGQNVIHRDLKPENIFLCSAGPDGQEHAKVLDFGISKIRGGKTLLTNDFAVLGTPNYMAPEQATGNQAEVDARTDIFALGLIAYEMLSGYMAFDGDSIPQIMYRVAFEQPRPITELTSSLPVPTVLAIQRALQKKKEERFESVEAFVEMFTGETMPVETLVPDSIGVQSENSPRISQKPSTFSVQPTEAQGLNKSAQTDAGIPGDRSKQMMTVAIGIAAGVVMAIVAGVWWTKRSKEPELVSIMSTDTEQAIPSAKANSAKPSEAPTAAGAAAQPAAEESAAPVATPTPAPTTAAAATQASDANVETRDDAAGNATTKSGSHRKFSQKLSGQQKVDIAARVLRAGEYHESIRLSKRILEDNPEKRIDAECIIAIAYCALGELAPAQQYMRGLSGAHLSAACKKCNEKGLMSYAECVGAQ